jgi:alpha-2-macroglobulin
MTRPNDPISLLLIFCLMIGSVAQMSVLAKTNDMKYRARQMNQDEQDSEDKPEGLRFRLSEAPDQPEIRPTPNVAPATPLSETETANILKRLPPIKTDASDETDFALREKSLPPPRTGKTINVSFPAAENAPPPDARESGPLEVVRFSPEGDVPLAPSLSVTFSQPMVAVSSQEEAATNVPVKLSPQPPGKWRWVGTKTLLFEPEVRFPMATQYSVTVPAGAKSVSGATLSSAKSWSFATPPPTVKDFYPTKASVQRRDTLIFAEFDQRIDPAAVLTHIKVESAGRQFSVRLATQEEIEKQKDVNDLVKKATRDRWLAFRVVDSAGKTENVLPAAADINVSIMPGTPSAEGPLTTKQTQAFPFLTFGPLRVTKHTCGYDKRCRPGDQWTFTFTNPLGADLFDESKIKIEPAIERVKTQVYGNVLSLEVGSKPRTNYRVTLDPSIKDNFGQTLGANQTFIFNVGAADKQLFGSGGDLAVLDPYGPASYSVYSINHSSLKVRLYSVSPEDWPKWIEYKGRDDPKSKTPPGRLVFSKAIPVRGQPDETVETNIDLRSGLKNGFGQMLLIVEPTAKSADKDDDENQPIETWVQRTEIGLDAFVDDTDFVAWATSLRDGTPLADVKLTLVPYGTGTTGADGTARLALKELSGKATPNLLLAQRGNDMAILAEDEQEGTWHRKAVSEELRWYVFDDRGLYRPGEEIHVKGWLRHIRNTKDGDVGLPAEAANKIAYILKDPQSNEVSKGSVSINPFGGFDFALKLPATMNLGEAYFDLKAEGNGELYVRGFIHRFRVAEFRRPEFEVSAKTETEAPFFVGDHADVTVAANYFAGGGLPNAQVVWSVTSTPASFTPPNRDDFTFGKWTPWWTRGRAANYAEERHSEAFTGRTDPSGKHRLRIDFDSVKPARPSNVTAEAKVTDVNRQTWASKTTMLVHPANLYVGLKSDRTFVQKGEPLVVQSVVTDLDGQAAANHEIKMRAVLLDWKQEKGEWKEVETNPQECVVRSANDAVKCTFATREGGEYRITAVIRDDRERLNESELTLWVAGGKKNPSEGVSEEEIKLIPDRKEYHSGDTAQILVQAPFYPAEAVMTLQRSGIVRTERFRVDEPAYTLRIPIEEAWTPNIHVQVALVGSEDRNTGSAGVPPANSRNARAETKDESAERSARAEALPAKRPAYASGEINLSIPPLSRRIAVTATPREKALEPGGETVVNVEAKDAEGQSVTNSEVAVVVVDESVLALTDYKLADPVAAFYAERSGDTEDYHLRKDIVLATLPGERAGNVGGGGPGGALRGRVPPRMLAAMPMPSVPPYRAGLTIVTKSNALGYQEEPQIRLRENFNALAVFAPSVRTDANGRAQVQVKLPDNLTRYRVMAVAVAGGKQFGSGESAITARMPLMVRPSAPRFLNFGDRFELPIVLQNQTDSAMTVDVAVRATNAAFTGSADGRRVTVPANDRVEVRIPAAAVKAGKARFQIAGVSGRWADAAEIELPVWTPVTTEAFATYGEIDDGAITQPVKAPADVFKQFGGLEIETSSTQLQQLTDAFLYLQSYPYECSEQLSSRIISVAALRDVLSAFKTKDLPSPKEMEAAVTRDLERLKGMQNDDGGFGFWKRGDESWPYLSIHVAHALARAKQKGFDVPKEMFGKSEQYLRQIESHIPSRYGPDAQRALIAYALYVRAQMGDCDTARARKLIAEAGLENLSLESLGWLLSVLSGDKNSTNEVEAIRRHLNNRATETAADAHFACSYKDGDYLLLNSDRRADGVILEALIGDQPNNDLIPKIVRGLLDHRTKGRWGNTQENVFILLALDRYFNTYEKVTPDFIARVWLGDAYAGEQHYKGRSVDRQQVNVPMRYLADKGATQNLIVSKQGVGRLYYRIGMNYAPSDLNLKPADYGFTVERTYEAVDHAEDVRRDKDGAWHIKAGARVRVRLTMVAQSRRYHVALVDPMPAGFESLNPTLATTESIPEDQKQASVATYGSRASINGGYGWWWWRPQWFEHQNLRDERAEVFTSLLWEGVYNYSYVARATTPGLFVVPPAKAEEMYHPETFGRGKTDRVRID